MGVQDTNAMNHLYFLWAALRSLHTAYGKRADGQEQRAVEAYLAGSQTACELEHRERQWLRARS